MSPHLTRTTNLRHLFIVFTVLIIIAFVLTMLENWYSALQDTKTTLDHINSAQVQGVHSTLKSYDIVLRGLGSELVSKGTLTHPEKGRELIERVKSMAPDLVGLGLARPDGQLVLISGIKSGISLPNLLQQTESRDSFNSALKSDHIQLGRNYFMKTLGQWAIPIRTPIHDKAGKVIAMMTAGYNITAGSTGWANFTLPPQVKTALLRDDNFLQFISSAPASSLQNTYGQTVRDETIKQVAALKTDKGFTSMYFPALQGEFYVSHQRIAEYGLLSAAFVPRTEVLGIWGNKMFAPTVLLFFYIAAGVWAYRRSAIQQEKTQGEVDKLTNWQRAVLDSTDYSMISTDTTGNIVSFNSTAERMLGYSADEMIGKQTPAVFHDANEVIQRARELSVELNRHIEPGFEVFVAKARIDHAEEREWTFVHKNGHRFPVRLTVTPIHDADGKFSGFLGVASDLTESRRAQISLQESEARYHSLFEGASDSIFLMDGETFIECNPATLRMFGCTREQIIGQPPYKFSPEFQPDGRSSKEKALEKIAAAFNGESPYFEWQHCRHDGTPFAAEVSLNVVYIGDKPHLLATVRDISERKEAEAKLEYLVQHDPLTGLINRYALHQEIEHMLALNSTAGAALMLIDLDRFKEINDTLGHHIGDKILQQIGPLLAQSLQTNTVLISRLGGDEFTVFITGITSEKELERIASQLRLAIKHPFEIDSIHLEVDSSIGIALYPQHGKNSHELLRSADVAMYMGKSTSGGIAIYDPTTDLHSHERLAIIGELGSAIRDKQLLLHYQPKFDLHTRRITGFEALVRWQHPKLGLIYPDSFIPLAEVSDVIHPLTLEVLNIAFAQHNEWLKSALSFSIAVNISARNLSDTNCMNKLQNLLQHGSIDPSQLELEITESSLMQDPERAISRLNKLAALGVKLTIDDFGTGYSSLAYLKQLPIQTLKIDRIFVKDMINNSQDEQIVRSTIDLAHSLNINVVAEGVEDAQTYEMLEKMGCDLIQGYYFSRPLPWNEMSKWMEESNLLKTLK